MLGTAADGLDRSPHVAFRGIRSQRAGKNSGSFNPAAFINRQRSSLGAIRQYLRPHHVSVALDHRVRATQFMGFVRIEGGVNSSKHHVRAASPCQGPNFVAAQRIRGVDADANDIARLNLV